MIFGVSFNNNNARKAAAILEGILADIRHAVGDYYARKPGATNEGTIADARHTVWECNARQAATIIESIIADACHATVRRNNTCFAT